jgi:hypothetical protein
MIEKSQEFPRTFMLRLENRCCIGYASANVLGNLAHIPRSFFYAFVTTVNYLRKCVIRFVDAV